MFTHICRTLRQRLWPNRLKTRLVAPTLVLTVSMFLGVAIFSYRMAEEMYISLVQTNVETNIRHVMGVLIKAQEENIVPMPTTRRDRVSFLERIFHGKLGFLSYDGTSGVIIADSTRRTQLKVYPQQARLPNFIYVQDILTQKSTTFTRALLPDDTAVASIYYPPLDIHIVGFNTLTFGQTPQEFVYKSFVIGVFATMALLLMVILVTFLDVLVIAPLRQIGEKMAHIIASDSFNTPVDIPAPLEVSGLIAQFNTLIRHIDHRDQQLKTHADTLESLVAERTYALKETQKQLVLRERLAAIGEFASSVAHELRNPLSSIKIGVEKISAVEGMSTKDARRLELVNKEIDRLDHMLKGILAFAASTPTHQQAIPFNALWAEVESILITLCREHKTTLHTQGVTGATLLWADEAKTKQALINIVKNAAEASPQGGDIHVHVTPHPKEVIITVQNHGQPIPHDVQKRLFEPFFTTKPNGTGLGLATTKRLMEEMHGNITITSNTQEGTTVTLALPLAEA